MVRANIGWSLLAAALWERALAALVSYWRFPENALNSRFQAFDVQGIVPVAYALFAVALGIAVGSVIRRVLPSLAVTLGIFVALRAVIGVLPAPALHGPHHEAVPAGRAGLFTTRGLDPLDELCERPRREPGRRVPSVRNLPPQCRTALVKGCRSQRPVPDLQRIPSAGHLPARQPILGLPGHRGGMCSSCSPLALAGFAWWYVLSPRRVSSVSGASGYLALGQHRLEHLTRVAARRLGDLLRRALGDDGAALVAALGTEVDDPVGRLDHVEVVLNDDDRVALLDQTAQNLQQTPRVLEVQPRRRLVEDVEGVARSAAD